MNRYAEFLKEIMESNDAEAVLRFFRLIIFASILSVAIALVIYVLRAIGVYTMAKSAGVSAPWMAFVPLVNGFTFGAIAEKYVKRDGSKTVKFSWILLFLSVAKSLLSIVFLVVSVIQTRQFFALLESNQEFSIPQEAMRAFFPVVFLFFLIAGIGLAHLILHYVATYRLFLIFHYQNAALFTTLSVLGMLFASDLIEPILLFVVRKHTPVFDYREQLNRMSQNLQEPDEI